MDQEEYQLYIQHYLIPLNYPSIPNQIEHYQSTFQLLTEENHQLRKLLNLNQQHQIICLTKEQLQEEVYKMIDFLMKNLNYLSKEQIFAYQKTFRYWAQKKALKSIFFQIFTRYLQAVKTREEMIKFIIRKSMKHQKQSQNKEQIKEKKQIKKMNNAFVKQLFQNIVFLKNKSKFYFQYYYIFSLTQYFLLIKLLKFSKYQYYIRFNQINISNWHQMRINKRLENMQYLLWT